MNQHKRDQRKLMRNTDLRLDEAARKENAKVVALEENAEDNE